jgi:zinc protease
MKKLMKPLAALVMTLLFVSVARAQMGPLPVDEAVRTGTLDNGLTYYIRHNELPKGQAEFYIAQKVGSMQEEENQRGLAHFLEHMAFNGTENFPGKKLLEYLESVGAKFGNNINAGTSWDQTYYTLMNIPVERQPVVDSAMLVLRDWSCGISLEGEAIDAERGVIREEMRMYESLITNMRVTGKILPGIFPDSRYGDRFVIGTAEVIENFTHQEIRDYYNRWYRPDLQAIIVVGDIDVDYIEAKIRSLFGPIAMPENPAERVYWPVPDNTEPIVVTVADKELTEIETSIMFKHDPMPTELRNTPLFMIQNYLKSAVASMMNARLNELAVKAEPPFLGASVYDSQMLGITLTKEALTGNVTTDEQGVAKGFSALLTELVRMKQHGFTISEYERFKANFLTNIETSYNERDKRRNNSYAREYLNSFIEIEPIPGIEAEYALYNQLVPMLQLEMINKYAAELVTTENVVIVTTGPQKDGLVYPTKEEFVTILNEVSAAQTEPYVEEVSDEPLVPVLPKAGKVKKTTHDPIFDATVWTLSNGARVVVKPTTLKDDEIRMTAVSPGGSSLIVGKEHDAEVKFINDVAGIGGLGNFSATDLPKVLAGKNARVSASVSEMTEIVSGSSSTRDLETLMQLTYLKFTAPRADLAAFTSWKNRKIAELTNAASSPMLALSDSLSQMIYNRNPRRDITKVEDVEALDYAEAIDFYRERFADASNFTFIFVGNVDPATLRPLVEQYIATLPSTKKNRETAGEPILMAKGNIVNHFDRVVEEPSVTMVYVLNDIIEPTLKNTIELSAVEQVLKSRYVESLREDEGGTYSPMVGSSFSSVSKQAALQVMVITNAAQYKRLAEIILSELNQLATDGPSDADFQKIKEYMLKTDTQNRQENGFWMDHLINYYRNGLDHVTGYADAVHAMTKDDIRAFARRLLDAGNLIDINMNGITAPAE